MFSTVVQWNIKFAYKLTALAMTKSADDLHSSRTIRIGRKQSNADFL